VHLQNLQAVAGTVVLSLQAGHEPQKVGISGPPTPERLSSGSPQACQFRCLAVWDSPRLPLGLASLPPRWMAHLLRSARKWKFLALV